MSVACDVILQWDATPAQFRALGVALWRWCDRTAGAAGAFQYLDNQALADLLAGLLPASSTPRQSDGRGVHFRMRDETSRDRLATIAGLWHELPTAGVEDVLIDGASWNLSPNVNRCRP